MDYSRDKDLVGRLWPKGCSLQSLCCGDVLDVHCGFALLLLRAPTESWDVGRTSSAFHRFIGAGQHLVSGSCSEILIKAFKKRSTAIVRKGDGVVCQTCLPPEASSGLESAPTTNLPSTFPCPPFTHYLWFQGNRAILQ